MPRSLIGAAALAVAAVEVAAHVRQLQRVPDDGDWQSARTHVAAELDRGDAIVFAPEWVEPLGRSAFGSFSRIVATDRASRSFEVSIRGARDPTLAGWRLEETASFGAVTVRRLANPAPVTVVYDFVAEASSARRDVPAKPGIVQPPPGDDAPWWALVRSPPDGGVPRTIFEDERNRPRACLGIATVPNGSVVVRFPAATLGRTLTGHHGLPYGAAVARETRAGAPLRLEVRAGDTVVGRAQVELAAGWTAFSFDTAALAGTVRAIEIEVRSDEPTSIPYGLQMTAVQ